jgi:hypothetical protein
VRGRRRPSGRDALVAALVVAIVGVAALLPRTRGDAIVIVAQAPARPCEGVAPDHYDACLRVARAIVDR